jgi:hypothetical protein
MLLYMYNIRISAHHKKPTKCTNVDCDGDLKHRLLALVICFELLSD